TTAGSAGGSAGGCAEVPAAGGDALQDVGVDHLVHTVVVAEPVDPVSRTLVGDQGGACQPIGQALGPAVGGGRVADRADHHDRRGPGRGELRGGRVRLDPVRAHHQGPD